MWTLTLLSNKKKNKSYRSVKVLRDVLWCPQRCFLVFLFVSSFTCFEENGRRSRHNVEGFFCRCTIFRLAKPAFFRYNENFTLVRDFYVAYFVIPEISKIIDSVN